MRKGARSIKDIPPTVLQQLNHGEIATVNLVEWLAIDQAQLLGHVLQPLGRSAYLPPILATVAALKKPTVNSLNQAIGAGLLAQATAANDTAFLQTLATHPADMVRCWAAYTVGGNNRLTVEEMLQRIQPFAADEHFGVREISWLATRPTIARCLAQSIQLLSGWAKHGDAHIRRFASEATRPRGVWCSHIEALKQSPEQALDILQPLKADPARYVQDSVGNWLNDAAKTRPDFVQQLCQQWTAQSPGPATAYIVKKALRSIGKDN
jgi:3-methyladenine DNA glycosylase AlkC